MNSRHIAVLTAAVVLLVSVVGTGSYDGVTADRPVEVGVSDDELAYLGFDDIVERTDTGPTLTVTVTNQFPSRTSLTEVLITVGGTTVDLTARGPLTPGESATATFSTVLCPSFVTVEAVGPNVDITLDRRVECPATPTPSPTPTTVPTDGEDDTETDTIADDDDQTDEDETDADDDDQTDEDETGADKDGTDTDGDE
jgi:hypothetical protein